MTTPKPESWEERLSKRLPYTKQRLGKGVWKDIINVVSHEKQLSYQEAVEKMVKIIDEDIGHWHQTASMDVGYHDALVSIRHQLSILKGEKK